MESFALLREHLAMCGIAISQTSPKIQPINGKNSTMCIVLCVNVTLTTIVINKANTIDEYTNILLKSSSVGTCGIFYAIIIWKTSKLGEFINSLADTVKESE